MAQEASGQSGARARNLDDGLRLRSVPVRAVAEAAGLSHLHFRLPHCPGRQGVLRARLWPAPEAAERGARPHLQPDQQSGSRNARRPSRDLGRSRGESGVRLGHGGHLDQPLGLCASRVGHRPFRPGLWRHGFSPGEDSAAIRRDFDRVPGGGRDEGHGGGGRSGARHRSGRGALSRDSGQSDERPCRYRPCQRDRRGPRRRRGQAPGGHRRQHLPRTPVPDALGPWRRSHRDLAHQICRRPFRPDRRRLLGRGSGARADPGHAHDPGHDVRSPHRLAARCARSKP